MFVVDSHNLNMEFKFALRYLNLSVKRKLSKFFDFWKSDTLVKTLNTKLYARRLGKRRVGKDLCMLELETVCLTEPSPVSTKILRKNRRNSLHSTQYAHFMLTNSENTQKKPLPIKPFLNTKTYQVIKKRGSRKENKYQCNDIAVVSSISASFFY